MNRKKKNTREKNFQRRFRYVSVWIVYVTEKKNKSSMYKKRRESRELNCIGYQQGNHDYGLFVALTSLSLR